MTKEPIKDWQELSKIAWNARENAHIYGKTKVGAALVADNGKIFIGCNVEHIFRSHDIHAEVNAIGSMIASGGKKIKKILIVAERDFFTPCGSCMDWIMLFSSKNTLIGFQGAVGDDIQVFRPVELMPHYPK